MVDSTKDLEVHITAVGGGSETRGCPTVQMLLLLLHSQRVAGFPVLSVCRAEE